MEAEGYDTLEAENGKVALDILESRKYDIALILLDLTMPVMNGFDLLANMKESGLLTSIPVIVATGSDHEDDEIRSLDCGASDFITKPYNPDIVRHRVKSILRLCDNAALINKLEIDRLTGVYSREAFYRHAQMMLDEHRDEEFDLICTNIDNFKMINSKYGVIVGDELLHFIGEHNLGFVGKNSLCGRLGADTFAALRPRQPLHTQDEVGRMHLTSFKDAPVKNFIMQYGVYEVKGRDMSVPDMCDSAQIAISSIKRKYGVYYAVYDESMRRAILREHQLSNFMEQALHDKQFVVYLQPKHDVDTGKIAGAEALVRWIHPELGFISPGEFIPLFERNGFIAELDRYIWAAVCKILQKWQKEGRRPIPVSVNASRADFMTDGLVTDIVKMTDSYKVPHELLHFEVTESAYTDNPQKIISAISTLRSLGFLIEMDDFGSGYSSLNMLSELPIDILKLDMRFLKKDNEQITDNKRSILSFIVGLSKWLQFPTVAEGVETKEEVELLQSMGCNYIQGFYFAKPMPVSDFEKYALACESKAQEDNKSDEKAAPLKPTQKPDENKPTILVVEDIMSNRELLETLLEPGYNVATANNGEQAYSYIKANYDKLSCVLLDLLMPVLDGFQLIDKLRRDGIFDELPIIITSESGNDSEQRAIRLGADSFVGKPYNPEILFHHVKKAVVEREYRRMSKKL